MVRKSSASPFRTVARAAAVLIACGPLSLALADADGFDVTMEVLDDISDIDAVILSLEIQDQREEDSETADRADESIFLDDSDESPDGTSTDDEADDRLDDVADEPVEEPATDSP